jgi:hypothetical protein
MKYLRSSQEIQKEKEVVKKAKVEYKKSYTAL